MTTPAAQAKAAKDAGRDAARAGQPITRNPYRGDADTARERVLARMWMIGYGIGNTMPVDFTS